MAVENAFCLVTEKRTMKIHTSSAAILLLSAVVGCASQLYWVQEGKTIQEISADLYQCRVSAQPQGGKQVFSAQELEQPCMMSKGYKLSSTPQN